MNRRFVMIGALCLSLCSAPLFAAPAAPATKRAQPQQRADVAAPKPGKYPDKPNKRFLEMHEKFLQEAKAGDIDLLFLGDSITEGWAGRGKDVWKKHYADKYGHVANFGISGDRTQHVLWRIDHGELDNIHPKVIVLMIGTNNAAWNPPAQIANAVKKIVEEAREKTGAKILLLSVFPRGATPDDKLRKVNEQVNEQIKKLDDGKNVRYFELWNQFLDKDGNLTKEIMPDRLHPNQKGYEIWADAMDPLLAEMMGQSNGGGQK
jgi:lysophospholipase L1-like esterase